MANIAQRVVWTILPNGVKEGGTLLKASVLISPRLTLANNISPANLSHFADWLDWPKVIEGATFGVSVDNGPLTAATRVSAVRSEIWKAIFPATTFVRPYKFDDLRNKVILSYPVATLANAIESIYGEVGGSAGAELPSRSDLRVAIYGRDFAAPGSQTDSTFGAASIPDRRQPPPQPLEPRQVLELLRQDKKRADVALRKNNRPRYEAIKAAVGGASQIYGPDKALDLFAFYHRPLQQEVTHAYTKKGPNDPQESAKWNSHAKSAMPAANTFKNEIDFHQIVSSLIQYNELCRLCGLVVELEFPAAAAPVGPHKLRLAVNWPKAGGQVATEADVIPVINTDRKPAEFFAAPETPASAISGRYLRLEKSGYDLVQMDVDGAGMKIKNLSRNLTLKDPDPPINEDSFALNDREPDATGLPALRTAGLMLAQERRDLAIQALVYRNSALQDALAGGQPVDELFAEDVIRGFRVDIQDVAGQKWNSLFYRNIDFLLLNSGASHATTAEEGMARLAASQSTDGSVPDVLKLHEGLFSWRGWSLAAPEPGKIIDHKDQTIDDTIVNNDEETPPGLPLKTVYRATPKTLPSLRFGRRYRVRVRLVDLAGASEPFTPDDAQPADAVSNMVVYRRHEPIEAPALALVQGGSGVEAPGDGESMGHLAIRTLNDTPNLNAVPTSERARRHIVPPRTSHRFAEHHGVFDTAPGGKIDPSLYTLLAGQDAPLAQAIVNMPGPPPALTPTPTTFSVAPEGFKLPFLPDPLALGVAIRIFGVDGINSNTVYKVPLYGGVFDPAASPAWPKAEPFSFVVEDRSANDAKFDAASREFRISLNKGERAKVRVSCLIPKSALAILAVAEMIRAKKGNQALVEAVQLIENGRHWMFTPWREVILTHAVQKPLITPQFPNPIPVNRLKGQVEAYPFLGKFPLHSKSTTRIDLHARWIEPVDNPAATADPEAAGPVTRNHTAVAFTTPVARLEAKSNVLTVRDKQHVFADTHYRRVIYKLDATTRFREFMAPPIRGDEMKLKVTSNEQVGWVPNSAPPPQPDLLYVMPTFGWSRNESGDRKTSLRAGGGLRVYLDRPWFATGFPEMLAVTLPPTNPAPTESALDSTYKKSVTMWGADPIWAGGAVSLVSPPKSAFPLARWKPPLSFDGTGFPAEEGTDLPNANFNVDNLVHPEDAQLKLSVAPHAVGYDPERRLYYCDIVVNAPRDAYFPFIRLAVARYNPLSTDGAHLSPIILTEFQQLTPDRLAVVTRRGPHKVHAAIYGPTVPTQRWGEGRLPITGVFGVEIQVLDPGADPELGWRKVEAPPPAPGGLTAGAATARPGAAISSSRALSAAPPAAIAAPPARAAAPPAAAAREVDELVAAGRYTELVARPDLTLVWQRPLLWEGEIDLPLVESGAGRRLMIVEAEVYQTGDVSSGSTNAVVRPGIGGRVVYFETIDA